VADLTGLYEQKGKAIVLNVHVSPGAGRSAVVGRHGDAVKVRVAAPPVGGRANDATAALLAETFGLKDADVTITAGETSRTKRFTLKKIDVEEFERRLRLLLGVGGGSGGEVSGSRRSGGPRS